MPSALADPAVWAFGQLRVMVWVLAVLRLGGLFMVLPGFGQARYPTQIKALLVILMAFVLAPTLPPPKVLPTNVWDLAALALGELAAGALMGLAVAWIVDMVAFSGQLMDVQIGYSFVQFMDPVTAHPASVAGSLLGQVTLVLLLVSGLHHQMILALVESYRIVPFGAGIPLKPQLVILAMGQILSRGFQLAFPVLFVLFVVDFVAGISGKLMPQLQLVTLTFPLKIALGLAVLGVVMREFGPWLAPLFEAAPREALRLLI